MSYQAPSPFVYHPYSDGNVFLLLPMRTPCSFPLLSKKDPSKSSKEDYKVVMSLKHYNVATLISGNSSFHFNYGYCYSPFKYLFITLSKSEIYSLSWQNAFYSVQMHKKSLSLLNWNYNHYCTAQIHRQFSDMLFSQMP